MNSATEMFISIVDGLVNAVDAGGVTHPLMMHGKQLQVSEHWEPKSFSFLPESEYIQLDLHSRDGDIAVHFYNARFEFACNTIAGLPKMEREKLEVCGRVDIANCRDQLIRASRPTIPRISDQFAALSPATRVTIFRASEDEFAIAQRALVWAAGFKADGLGGIDASYLEACLCADWGNVQTKAILDAKLPQIPSPYTGAAMVPSSAIFLAGTPFVSMFAYQYLDQQSETVCFILCADHHTVHHGDWEFTIQAIYFPGIRTVVFKDDRSKRFVSQFRHGNIEFLLLQEIVRHPVEIAAFMVRGCVDMAPFIYFRHLGHHLWNELSGMDIAWSIVADKALPTVYVIDAAHTEMFGRLETLFPALQGKVDRGLSSKYDMRRFLYDRRILFAHLTGHHISETLAAGIIDAARQAEHHQMPLVHSLRLKGFSIVVVGLRVENRTLVDNKRFCTDVVESLKSQLGPVAIIVDGHNSKDGEDPRGLGFGSVWDPSGTCRPIALEQDVVAELARIYRDDESVRIISTIGKPMAESIFWASHAKCFVAPWGAGLSKYKWVCNLPGLVVTSREFGANFESNLYDDPAYRDSIVASIRSRPGDTEDVPESPQLISMKSPLYVNFKIGQEQLRILLQELVGRVR